MYLSRKKIILLSTIILTLVSIFSFSIFSQNQRVDNSAAIALSDCTALKPKDALTACFSEKATLAKNSNDIMVMMNYFQKNEKAGLLGQDTCHPATHRLGENFSNLKTKPLFSKSELSTTCNTGFVHGYLNAESLKNPKLSIYLSNNKNFCNLFIKSLDLDISNYKKFPREYFEEDCYHGLGHGIAQNMKNNLNNGYQACKDLSKNQPKSFSGCADGVAMAFYDKLVTQKLTIQEREHYIKNCALFEDSMEQDYCLREAKIMFISSEMSTVEEYKKDCLSLGENLKITSCFAGFGIYLANQSVRVPNFKGGAANCISTIADPGAKCLFWYDAIMFQYGITYPSKKFPSPCKPINALTQATCQALNALPKNKFPGNSQGKI